MTSLASDRVWGKLSPLKLLRAFILSRYPLAILAGLLLAASFPKLSVAGFAWIAPGLMLLAALGKPARLYGHRVLPFILIGLGGSILYTSGAIDLLVSLVRR